MKFICEEIRELSSGIQLMEDDIAILRDNAAAADSNLTQQLKRRRNVAKGKERTRTLERTPNIEYWYQRSSLRWGA
jgi:predicted RNase H-like nuclease (RuvC/YqgF family)